MQKLKRAVHLDFHTLPGIYNFGENFDAEEFAERLFRAEVTLINMFFQCNIGHVYYPTKIGVPYPEMRGDMFGDIVRECKKRGIRVVGYTNTAINHVQALLHPEWIRADKEGRRLRENPESNNFSRPMCFNNEEYRTYLSSLIREVMERYDIDGIFADCMNPVPFCYCEKCRADMEKMGLDIENENHVRYFSYQTFKEFAHMIRATVPEGKLCQQTGVPFDWDEAKFVSTHGELECLPGGSWGYDFFGPQVAYMRKCRDEVLYMTGRFQKSWGDFGGYKTKASMENDCFDALCQGVQVSIGDHLHPKGNLDPKLYETIGEIYKRIKKYEPYTDGANYRAEIGILNDKTAVTKTEMRGGLGRNPSVTGAARMLAELGYGFDVLNEDMDFSPYPILILPDALFMTDNLKNKLSLYVAGGGRVLSSGEAGLLNDKSAFACPAWSFLTFEGMDESNSSYYEEEGRAISMYCHGILMTSYYKTRDYIKPYFNRHWNGEHGYFYTPPEKATGQAAVAEKDGVCHICFRIFESYNMFSYVEHKKLVQDILKRFLPLPLLKKKDLPSTLRATLTGKDAYDLLHIKTSYPEKRGRSMCVIEEHVVLPKGRRIWVRGEYKAAYRLPEKTPIPVLYQDGYTEVMLPEIEGYAMFLLERTEKVSETP